jgi:LuxR family transcriptional regulator, maltose regulon positive regulatory protein
MPMTALDSDITLSRIRPPELPANFLSRRHLFELIDDQAPGYTMVVAPAGYGKTSLIAEWAKQSKKKVIWYTMSETDSAIGLATYLMSAIRQEFPNFAPDLEAKTVTSIFQAIANLEEDIVLVLDNVVDVFTYQLNITQSYMDAIPDNIHIFALRRIMPTVSLKRFSSIGRLSVITAGDLVFSKDEIKSLLQISGVDANEKKINQIAQQTHGWPSAVGIIASGEDSKFDLEVDDSLVKNLVSSKFEKLSKETRELLIAMSSFEVFDLDLVTSIMQKPANETNLNKLAAEGVFLMLAAGQKSSYIFNNSAREVINEIALADSKNYRKNQIAISELFQLRDQSNLSVSHAIKSGDSDYLRQMFKPVMRKLIQQSDGRNILYWSNYLPTDNTRNKLFSELAKIMGHLVSFEFERTIQLIEEMNFSYKDTPLAPILEKINATALAHVAFSRGRITEFDVQMGIFFSEPATEPGIEQSDRLGILRMMAARSFIFEDSAVLNSIEAEVQEIIKESKSPEDLFIWQTIRAMKLFLEGEYLQAFEAASLSEEIGQRNEYAGFFGFTEAIYIKARCHLEFCEEDKATEELKKLAKLAREWQQWPWVFMAESFMARSLMMNGKVEEAFAVVRDHRQLASEFKGEDGLSLIIDINELFLRFWVKDYERSSQILNRLPKDLIFTHQYRQALGAVSKNEVKKKVVPEILESDTAREKIWKSLVGCEANISQETLAMDALKIGLDVGARVGAKESFLRQDPTILELIIRSASKRPTVYLEELARAAAQRMNAKNNQNAALTQPLTKREIDVLRSLATGKPITAIGKTLHISHNTMKTHLRNIYRKLSASGREEAVVKAQTLFII